jgi:DNA-binding NarL/FixJ family response regulator
MGPVVRVFFIEDHEIVQRCVERALSADPGIVFVGSAASASDALARVRNAKPDVVLVDLGLPDRSESTLLTGLRREVPDAKLVVFSGYEDEYHVFEALRAGAHGYVSKTAPVDEIATAIRRVANGEMVLSTALAGLAVAAMQPSISGGALGSLTRRELEVVRELVAGYSARAIGARLGISAKTVEVHRAKAYRKLGCDSPQALLRLALRHGLVTT